MYKVLTIVVLGASLNAACSSQQVYDSTRALRVEQCQQLSGPEQEECMRQTHETQPEREDREKEAERR